jgi:hypothetical protein
MNATAAQILSSGAQVSGSLVEKEPNELVYEVEQLGIAWADADEAANLLEETKKTLLAQYTVEAQRGTPATGAKTLSMANAEALALADPRYAAHLDSMVKARTQSNRCRVRYDSGRVKIELLRSLIAARREEMRFQSFGK